MCCSVAHALLFTRFVAPPSLSLSLFPFRPFSQLQHQLALAKSIELLDAVKEVSLQEADSRTWMAPALQNMLDNEAKLRSEFKDRTRALAFIVGIICDLFVDWYKLMLGGQDVRPRIPELEAFLTTQYSYQGLSEMWFGLGGN